MIFAYQFRDALNKCFAARSMKRFV